MIPLTFWVTGGTRGVLQKRQVIHRAGRVRDGLARDALQCRKLPALRTKPLISSRRHANSALCYFYIPEADRLR